MTVVSSPGWWMPDPSTYGALVTGATGFSAFLMDSGAEKVAFIFRVPKSGTLARVGFRTGTVTTGDTLKISFQDVDAATGDPDGTADQFRTQAVQNTDDNVWFRTGLLTNDGTDTGTKRSVTRDQILSVVIEFDSFVAGSLNIAGKQTIGATARAPWVGQHYVDHFTAAWAKSNATIGVLAVEYDDGTFAFIANTLPTDTNATQSINSGTSPSEIALKFQLPVPCSVGGAWVSSSFAGDAEIVLYDSDGTSVLASTTIDKDINSLGGNTGTLVGRFASDITLAKDTFYRLALKPTSVTSVSALSVTVPSTPGAAQLDQVPGGQNFHWSERTGAGAWADTTTKRPVMGLLVSGFDDGQGSGAIMQSLFNNGIN